MPAMHSGSRRFTWLNFNDTRDMQCIHSPLKQGLALPQQVCKSSVGLLTISYPKLCGQDSCLSTFFWASFSFPLLFVLLNSNKIRCGQKNPDIIRRKTKLDKTQLAPYFPGDKSSFNLNNTQDNQGLVTEHSPRCWAESLIWR